MAESEERGGEGSDWKGRYIGIPLEAKERKGGKEMGTPPIKEGRNGGSLLTTDLRDESREGGGGEKRDSDVRENVCSSSFLLFSGAD